MTSLRIGITAGNGEFGFVVWFRYLLLAASWTLMVVTFPFSIVLSVKVIPEYKRAVIFRLGRILPGGARGPGLVFVTPCLDRVKMIDLRMRTFNLPVQDCLTKDAIEMKLETVLYYRVTNPVSAVTNIEDADHHTQYICAAVLRNTLSGATLHQLLSERDMLKRIIMERLDELTLSWGVKVERIEIKDIRLPAEMKQAMTKEAETARQANAKVISAEGEKAAMFALADGARMIASSPYGMQLHYLHTLSHLVTVPNPARETTLVFPVPFDFNNVSNFGFPTTPFDMSGAMPMQMPMPMTMPPGSVPPNFAPYQPNLPPTQSVGGRPPTTSATKPLSVTIPTQLTDSMQMQMQMQMQMHRQMVDAARVTDVDDETDDVRAPLVPEAQGSAANNSTSDSNNNHDMQSGGVPSKGIRAVGKDVGPLSGPGSGGSGSGPMPLTATGTAFQYYGQYAALARDDTVQRASEKFPAVPPSPSPPPPPSSAPSLSSISSLCSGSAASAARSAQSNKPMTDATVGSNVHKISSALSHASHASSSQQSTSQAAAGSDAATAAAAAALRKEMIDLSGSGHGHHNTLPTSPPPTLIPLSGVNLQPMSPNAMSQGGMLLQPIGLNASGMQNLTGMAQPPPGQPTSVYIVNMQQPKPQKGESAKSSSVSAV